MMPAIGPADDPASRTRDVSPQVHALRSAAAVRERCLMVHDWVAQSRSQHFTLDEDRLQDVSDYVVGVTRENYPDLAIPYHSRWRHFCAGGVDRWSALAARIPDPLERARTAVDLACVSVLLDAGAGEAWRYREAATGRVFTRSEGLAVASFEMFCAGGFSSEPDRPLQADSIGLRYIDTDMLARFFQVGPDNPLIGTESRARLLCRFGVALEAPPHTFGRRLARFNIVDRLIAGGCEISAPELLARLLDALSLIWKFGAVLGGVLVGDAGRHPASPGGAADHLVPFHKLTQWLVYSLIEPLEWAGLRVVDVDGLTALAEYRNGGLLIDLGVIQPRRPLDPAQKHDVSSELIVEWRALTVTLMDRLLPLVRGRLGLDSAFTLPRLLQGGTWSAGRKIALTLRPPDGLPPIAIAADGTVF